MHDHDKPQMGLFFFFSLIKVGITDGHLPYNPNLQSSMPLDGGRGGVWWGAVGRGGAGRGAAGGRSHLNSKWSL